MDFSIAVHWGRQEPGRHQVPAARQVDRRDRVICTQAGRAAFLAPMYPPQTLSVSVIHDQGTPAIAAGLPSGSCSHPIPDQRNADEEAEQHSRSGKHVAAAADAQGIPALRHLLPIGQFPYRLQW